MNAEIFTDARSMITLVSFVTFVGIIWWTYVSHKPADFDKAAMLPFEDGDIGQPIVASHDVKERSHG